MTGEQKWVLGLTSLASLASLIVALDALVFSTALSTMRLHVHASIGDTAADRGDARRANRVRSPLALAFDLTDTRAVNLGPDR